MRKFNLLIVFMVLNCLTHAQEAETEVRQSTKIDFEDIETETKAKNSIFNFDKLYKRYELNDTSLDVVDYKHLYYGFTFTHRYSPRRRNEEEEKKVNKILAKSSPTYSDYKNILKISENVLKQNPFDIDMIWVTHLAYSGINSRSNAKKYLYKFDKIVETIFLSGDGLSTKTAMTVIDSRHEHIILNIAGFEFSGEQSLVSKHYDYLKLKANKYDLEGLYFNIERIIEKK